LRKGDIFVVARNRTFLKRDLAEKSCAFCMGSWLVNLPLTWQNVILSMCYYSTPVVFFYVSRPKPYHHFVKLIYIVYYTERTHASAWPG